MADQHVKLKIALTKGRRKLRHNKKRRRRKRDEERGVLRGMRPKGGEHML